MLIDWFTVGAQVFNFIILVWLMKRFLYKPILHAIDAREKRIADELADADARKTEAGKEREEFERKNEEFDEKRSELLKKVTVEADTEKKRLLGEAREEADAMSSKRLETWRRDAQNLKQSLTRRTQDEVFSITRKVLTDLADTDLEKRATTVFLQKLRAMEHTFRT
jgi:F-type H+-transporting ATPase subunit b